MFIICALSKVFPINYIAPVFHWLNHRYTTLNRDWKRITRANTFLCKKRESIETMRVSPSTPQIVFENIVLSRERAGY